MKHYRKRGVGGVRLDVATGPETDATWEPGTSITSATFAERAIHGKPHLLMQIGGPVQRTDRPAHCAHGTKINDPCIDCIRVEQSTDKPIPEIENSVPAYTVHAAGTAHCHCGAGETWGIVLHIGTPEELALSSSYDSREHAEELAEELSDAYNRGRGTAKSHIRDLAQALQWYASPRTWDQWLPQSAADKAKEALSSGPKGVIAMSDGQDWPIENITPSKRIADQKDKLDAPEANSQGEDESTLRLKIKELARALQKVKECLTVRGADREIWDIVDAALKKEML